jgi:hypothetical protein
MAGEHAPEPEPSDEEVRQARARSWRQRIEELRSGGRGKRPPHSPREFTDQEAAAEAARSEDEDD